MKDLSVYEYTFAAEKGGGGAWQGEKEQVQEMVGVCSVCRRNRRRIGGCLAAAICHAQNRTQLLLLAEMRLCRVW